MCGGSSTKKGEIKIRLTTSYNTATPPPPFFVLVLVQLRTISPKQPSNASMRQRGLRKICQWFCELLQDDSLVHSAVFWVAEDDQRPVGAGRARSWETSHLKLELQRKKSEQTL